MLYLLMDTHYVIETGFNPSKNTIIYDSNPNNKTSAYEKNGIACSIIKT